MSNRPGSRSRSPSGRQSHQQAGHSFQHSPRLSARQSQAKRVVENQEPGPLAAMEEGVVIEENIPNAKLDKGYKLDKDLKEKDYKLKDPKEKNFKDKGFKSYKEEKQYKDKAEKQYKEKAEKQYKEKAEKQYKEKAEKHVKHDKKEKIVKDDEMLLQDDKDMKDYKAGKEQGKYHKFSKYDKENKYLKYDKESKYKNKGDKKEKELKDKVLKHKFKEKTKQKEKMDKLFKDEKEKKGNLRNRSKRAGLVFPVGRVARELKNLVPVKARVQGTASVYLAAIMEYVMAELLEVAGNTALQQGKKRINPRHIMLAIRGDEELDELIKATISEAGVPPDPRVGQALLDQKRKQRVEAVTGAAGGGGLNVFQQNDDQDVHPHFNTNMEPMSPGKKATMDAAQVELQKKKKIVTGKMPFEGKMVIE